MTQADNKYAGEFLPELIVVLSSCHRATIACRESVRFELAHIMASTHLHSSTHLKLVVLLNKVPSSVKVPCLDSYEIVKEPATWWLPRESANFKRFPSRGDRTYVRRRLMSRTFFQKFFETSTSTDPLMWPSFLMRTTRGPCRGRRFIGYGLDPVKDFIRLLPKVFLTTSISRPETGPNPISWTARIRGHEILKLRQRPDIPLIRIFFAFTGHRRNLRPDYRLHPPESLL